MRRRGLASLIGLVLVVTVDVAAGQTSSAPVPVEPSSSAVLTGLPAGVAPIVSGVSGRRYLEGAAVPAEDSDRPCCSSILAGTGALVRSADGDGRITLS
jgi:hypothetical protein